MKRIKTCRYYLAAAGFLGGLALLLGGCDILWTLFTPNGYLEQLKEMGVSDRVVDWKGFDDRGLGLAVHGGKVYVITPEKLYEVEEGSLEVSRTYSYTEAGNPYDYDDDEIMDQRTEQWMVRPHEQEGHVMMMNSRTGQTITLSSGEEDLAAVGGGGDDGPLHSLVWDSGSFVTRTAQWQFYPEFQELTEETMVNINSENLDGFPWPEGNLPGDHQLVNSGGVFISGVFYSALLFAPSFYDPGEMEGVPFGVVLADDSAITGTGSTPAVVLGGYDAQYTETEKDGLYYPGAPRFALRETGPGEARGLLQMNRSVYLYEIGASYEGKRVGYIGCGEGWMFDLSKEYVYALQRERGSRSCVLVKMVWGGGE